MRIRAPAPRRSLMREVGPVQVWMLRSAMPAAYVSEPVERHDGALHDLSDRPPSSPARSLSGTMYRGVARNGSLTDDGQKSVPLRLASFQARPDNHLRGRDGLAAVLFRVARPAAPHRQRGDPGQSFRVGAEHCPVSVVDLLAPE